MSIFKKWQLFKCALQDILQLRAKQTVPLVNKHYENEVNLRQQN